MNEIQLSASLEIKAREGRPPRVNILAYNGGVMNVPGWGPIIIDLQGLELPSTLPILADHANKLDAVIGTGTPAIEQGRRIVVAGTLSLASTAAATIFQLFQDGIEFQASVGVQPERSRLVREGTPLRINNQTLELKTDVRVIESGKLREVSVVPLGADGDSSVSIAAKMKETQTMSDNQETTAVVDPMAELREQQAKEMERIGAVQRICGAAHTEIAAQAIRENWNETQTELAVLRAERDQAEPARGGVGIHARSAYPSHQDVLAAALCIRAGYGNQVAEQYGERVMHEAERFRKLSLVDMAQASLKMDGHMVPSDRGEMLTAAISHLSLTQTLSNSMGRVLEMAHRAAAGTWRTFAAVRSAADFKQQTSIRGYLLGDLEEVTAGGEIRHADMSEAYFNWNVDTYAKMLTVSRKDLINDNLSLFEQTVPAMGRAAARRLSDLVWSVISANAGSHFAAGNNNLLTGANSELQITSLTTAIQRLREMTDPAGNFLDIEPRTLIVGPAYEMTARALLESAELSRLDTGDELPTGNALRSAAALAVEPRLTDGGPIAGATSTQWYLMAAPESVPVVVGFLEGKQVPTVEFFGLDHQVDRLAVSWRIYHDFGAALGETVSAIKSDGA